MRGKLSQLIIGGGGFFGGVCAGRDHRAASFSKTRLRNPGVVSYERANLQQVARGALGLSQPPVICSAPRRGGERRENARAVSRGDAVPGVAGLGMEACCWAHAGASWWGMLRPGVHGGGERASHLGRVAPCSRAAAAPKARGISEAEDAVAFCRAIDAELVPGRRQAPLRAL